MPVNDVDVSRAVSHALRHEPWLYELELDEDGWAPVDQLLEALHQQGGDWEAVDRRVLEQIVATAQKRRHEISGERIRALYGHSTPHRIIKQRSKPPVSLFHGTSPESWHSIKVSGLRPMGRQYLHLSGDVTTAMAVGRRKSPSPLILVVHAERAADAGIPFYVGNERVWLADFIPPEFIDAVDPRHL